MVRITSLIVIFCSGRPTMNNHTDEHQKLTGSAQFRYISQGTSWNFERDFFVAS